MSKTKKTKSTPPARRRTEPPPEVKESPLTAELVRRDQRICELNAGIDANRYQIALELSQIEAKGLFALWAFTSVTDYARKRHGLSSSQTSELLRVARACEKLPPFKKAMQEGEVHYSSLRALSKLVDSTVINLDNAQEWIDKTKGKTVTEVQAMAGQHDRVHRRVLELSDRELIQFDAALDLVRAQVGTKITNGQAIALVCQWAVEGGDTGGAKRRVLLNTCESCGKSTRATSAGPIEIPAQEVLDAVDAGAEVVHAEGPGKVQRTIPADTRRKLQARGQGRCIVPGCLARKTEDHHAEGREEGHDPDKMSGMCRAHHIQEHNGHLIRQGTWPDVKFYLRDGTYIGKAGDLHRADLPQRLELARARSIGSASRAVTEATPAAALAEPAPARSG